MSPLPLFHDGGHPHFYYWGVSSIFWSCSVTSLWCCCHPWLGSGILIPSQICFDQMLNESSLMTAGFQSLLGISKHVDSFYLHPTSSYRKEQLWTRSREDWHYSASFGVFWGPGHGEEQEGSFSPFKFKNRIIYFTRGGNLSKTIWAGGGWEWGETTVFIYMWAPHWLIALQ